MAEVFNDLFYPITLKYTIVRDLYIINSLQTEVENWC